MKNIKLEKDLIGSQFWPKIPLIKVKGDKEAKPFAVNNDEEIQEEIIQSWLKVAVFSVEPLVPFKVGYIHGDSIHLLKYEVETLDGKFGMRIGDDETNFFVIPTDLESELRLNLIEETDESNTKYSDLPLY